jgi:hypothetical protein
VAALIKSAVGLEAELIEGGRGEFTVWVGDKRIAQKDAHGFPEDGDVVAAVQQALARIIHE